VGHTRLDRTVELRAPRACTIPCLVAYARPSLNDVRIPAYNYDGTLAGALYTLDLAYWARVLASTRCLRLSGPRHLPARPVIPLVHLNARASQAPRDADAPRRQAFCMSRTPPRSSRWATLLHPKQRQDLNCQETAPSYLAARLCQPFSTRAGPGARSRVMLRSLAGRSPLTTRILRSAGAGLRRGAPGGGPRRDAST
jgi:hypothetical protein